MKCISATKSQLFFKLALLVSGVLIAHSKSTQAITPREVIYQDGQLEVTDGISDFYFLADGTFILVSRFRGGRNIKGFWTTKNNDPMRLFVKGEWYWGNKSSAPRDFRQMIIRIDQISKPVYIYRNFSADIENPLPPEVHRKSSFIIEELLPLMIPKSNDPILTIRPEAPGASLLNVHKVQSGRLPYPP